MDLGKPQPKMLATVLLLALALSGSQSLDISSAIKDMMWTLAEDERMSMQEPSDDHSDESRFDFIVVGAGTAGSVVASRLSENPNWSVLLLEAGGEEAFAFRVPYTMSVQVRNPDTNWLYQLEPNDKACAGLKGHRCTLGAGRVMGGSSTLNGMWLVRGNRRDFDRWEQLGNHGWGYDDVLPLFKKIEDLQIDGLDEKYHGKGGPVKVSHFPYTDNFTELLLTAGQQMGLKVTDYNGARQAGIARAQTSSHNGERWSASRAYLHPARGRSNLTVRKRCFVTRVLLEQGLRGARAVGVEYTRAGTDGPRRAYVDREVIVSAGAVRSPQLLLLSGLGPAAHLRGLGLPVVRDLPVGEGLQSHTRFQGFWFVIDEKKTLSEAEVHNSAGAWLEYMQKPVRKGPLSASGMDVLSFHHVKGANGSLPDWPIIEVQYAYSNFLSFLDYELNMEPELYDKFFKPLETKSAIQLCIYNLRPKSKGRVTLASKNAAVAPKVDPAFHSVQEDMEVTMHGIKELLKMLKTPVMQSVGARLYDTPMPGCEDQQFASDEYWRCAQRQMSLEFMHECCSVRMGPDGDRGAALDPRLRVRGVRGLRVVDLSVAPHITSGHTSVLAYMIGERGAELIKEDNWCQWLSPPGEGKRCSVTKHRYLSSYQHGRQCCLEASCKNVN